MWKSKDFYLNEGMEGEEGKGWNNSGGKISLFPVPVNPTSPSFLNFAEGGGLAIPMREIPTEASICSHTAFTKGNVCARAPARSSSNS